MDTSVEISIQEGIKRMIRETNRCIVVNGLNIETKHLKREIYSLFKTWFCREVRKYIGYGNTNTLTQLNNLSIICDGSSSQITNIMVGLPSYCNSDEKLKLVKKTFDNLKYEELYYNPPITYSYNSGDYSRQKTLTNVVKDINFSSILNIKY